MKWQTSLGFFLCLILSINAAAKPKAATKKVAPSKSAPATKPDLESQPAPTPPPSPAATASPQAQTPSHAAPSPDTVGLGAMIGTMGAINIKYWFESDQAADVGVEFMDKAWQVFYIDYYFHSPGFFSKQSAVYVALGTGGGFWRRADKCGRWNCKWNPNSTGTGNGFFVRTIVGNEWFYKKKAYSVYLEGGPSLIWYPSNGNTFDAAIGGRIYF